MTFDDFATFLSRIWLGRQSVSAESKFDGLIHSHIHGEPPYVGVVVPTGVEGALRHAVEVVKPRDEDDLQLDDTTYVLSIQNPKTN